MPSSTLLAALVAAAGAFSTAPALCRAPVVGGRSSTRLHGLPRPGWFARNGRGPVGDGVPDVVDEAERPPPPPPPPPTPEPSYPNLQLVSTLLRNQLFLAVGSGLAGGAGYRLLQSDFGGDYGTLLALGVAASVPLIALGTAIERSDSSLFADLNRSTDVLVLRLLGKKSILATAAVVALGLGLVTGVVEELFFRGILIPRIYATPVGHEDLLVSSAVSSLIFGLGHVNFLAILSNRKITSDTGVIFGLQTILGLYFAFLFTVLPEPNLIPPIVAHTLYDAYTLYSVHARLTGQSEYAASQLEKAPDLQDDPRVLSAIAKYGESFVEDTRAVFYIMDTNRDGSVDRRELKVGLYAYGLDLDDKFEATFLRLDADDSGSLDLAEFVDLIQDLRGDADAPRAAEGGVGKRGFLGVRG